MSILLQDLITAILVGIAVLVLLLLHHFHTAYKYWQRKGVPFLRPRFPLGNAATFLPRAVSVGILSKRFYEEFKRRNVKFGGVYLVTQPNLVLIDPDYIRDILTKDFQHFVDRGFYHHEKKDPISAHLFALDAPKWREVRVKLTPTFTSGKMKTMFWTVVQCCDYMVEAMQHHLHQDLEVKEYLGRFTTDVIGSCAFGIECNSFKYPDAEFRMMGKKLFEYSRWKSVKAFLMQYQPELAKQLGVINTRKEVADFFTKVVADTVEAREKNEIRRNDFLQILIDMRKESGFTLLEMAAQVFLFFVAGFETSSSVMTFALYELAKNQKLQTRLRQEVNEVLQRYDDKITYESIAEMKYLNQVLDETLRMYPSVPTLTRRCTQDYILRDTNLAIEKGTSVLISVLGLQMDPEYYPKPEVFDPDRFSDENRKNRHPFWHLPFGDGPRNCIGLRFGQMQSKIGIATVIKNFKLTVSPDNKPIRLSPYSFLLDTLDKVLLRAEKVVKV